MSSYSWICPNAGRMLQGSLPSACNFLHIDETPLVTCPCIKNSHICQILHEVKEEYGEIFEHDPVAW